MRKVDDRGARRRDPAHQGAGDHDGGDGGDLLDRAWARRGPPDNRWRRDFGVTRSGLDADKHEAAPDAPEAKGGPVKQPRQGGFRLQPAPDAGRSRRQHDLAPIENGLAALVAERR